MPVEETPYTCVVWYYLNSSFLVDAGGLGGVPSPDSFLKHTAKSEQGMCLYFDRRFEKGG